MSLVGFYKQCSRIVVLSIIYLCLTDAQSLNSTSTSFYVKDRIRFVDTEIALTLATPGATGNYQLYRTTDGGLSWTNITSKLSGSDSSPLMTPIYINPQFPSNIFIVGRVSTSFCSHDHGATWHAVPYQGTIFVHIEWHPTNANYVLAAGADYNLYLSKDGGLSWNMIKSGVTYFSWGDAGSGDVPETRVYYILYIESQSVPYNFIASDDFGTTELVLQTHAYQFIFFKHHIVTAIYLPTDNEVALTASPDIGLAVKNFHDIEFSFGDTLETNGFVFLDDSTGALYLGINHQDPYESAWGNVYVSDSTGTRYVLSLEHVAQVVVNSRLVLYDFDSISGVEGLYIANTVSNWEDESGDPVLTTRFSVDNGNTWQSLAPPHFDSQGQPIVCSGTCSLHLNGLGEIFNYFGPFYSAKNAIGLIVATGNTGDYLTSDVDLVNTYLSRDGGLTWLEVLKGSSIYEFGDHGGIIVFAAFGRETNTVYYTLDYGLTPLVPWQFTDAAVNVLNIVTEPSSTGEKFIVETESQVFALDFSKVFTRVCGESDYEKWSPSDGRVALHRRPCLMGHEITYLRRNATRECFNDEDEDYILSTVNCPCIEDDWECDFDYTRGPDGNCYLIMGHSEPSYPPSYCPPKSTYYKTAGYRKEAGNTCERGVDHSGAGPFDCPSGIVSKSKGWIAAAVLVPLVVVLILAGCIAIRSEKVREKLPFLKGLSTWKVGYFVQQDTALDIEEDETYRKQRELEEDDEEGRKFSVDTEDHEEPKKQNPPTTSAFFDDE